MTMTMMSATQPSSSSSTELSLKKTYSPVVCEKNPQKAARLQSRSDDSEDEERSRTTPTRTTAAAAAAVTTIQDRFQTQWFYDDQTQAPSPVVPVDQPTRMSPPPGMALEELRKLFAQNMKRDTTTSTCSTAALTDAIQCIMDQLQGNERRFLLPLVMRYSLENLSKLGIAALTGEDANRLALLQQAGGKSWNMAIVRVRRTILIDDSDSDSESDDNDEEEYDDYVDSTLCIDKLVSFQGRRPIDVRWFAHGLHSAEDGGLILETEQEIESGSLWIETQHNLTVSDKSAVYHTYMLAVFDRSLKKSKYTWFKY
jgi:hypothetical protein